MTAHLITTMRLIWSGDEMETLDEYLQTAFEQVLEKISDNIPFKSIRSELIEVIRYLCNPNPLHRGHPKNIRQRGSNYSLERFVQKLDLLRRKSELEICKLTKI